MVGCDPELQVDLGRGVEVARVDRLAPPQRSSRASPRSSPRPAGPRRRARAARPCPGGRGRFGAQPRRRTSCRRARRAARRRRRRRTRTPRWEAVWRPSPADRARRRRNPRRRTSIWRRQRRESPSAECRRTTFDIARFSIMCVMGALDDWRFCPRCGGEPRPGRGSPRLPSRAERSTGRTRSPPCRASWSATAACCSRGAGREPRRGFWDLPGGFLHETERRRRRVAAGVPGGDRPRGRAGAAAAYRHRAVRAAGMSSRSPGSSAATASRWPPTTSPSCAGLPPTSCPRWRSLARTSCWRSGPRGSGRRSRRLPGLSGRREMGRSAHASVRATVDHRQMDDCGILHLIEDDLSETWVDDLARDGVRAIERYLAKHLAFLPFSTKPPPRSVEVAEGLTPPPAPEPSRASPSAWRRWRKPAARRSRTAP